MPLDFEAIRKAFYGPPRARPPDRLPTREELLAENERIRLERRLELGLDPAPDGVGEYGSLIGGAGKPLTVIHRSVERLLRIEPMPLNWFDYPEARRAWQGRVEQELEFLNGLINRHLAGFLNRPTAAELASWLRSPDCHPRMQAALYNIFETILPIERPRLLSKGHFSVYEIARAVIMAESRAPGTVRWLHQFAVDPKQNSHR